MTSSFALPGSSWSRNSVSLTITLSASFQNAVHGPAHLEFLPAPRFVLSYPALV
ncbi:hypothetical protein IM043_gp083 [Bacillus phage SPG24]|uniref:hypothetical protein n=1 Tax=Bacillus phage SPG24 TaxID=1497851 RepID=UPI0022BA4AE0|nr:hypothetical protein IM043_gp083 [Bacillus phage SPG24]